MSSNSYSRTLSRRERQIMDALYREGPSTAVEVHKALLDAPSATAVRTLLGILEQKGHIGHTTIGQRYVYEPKVPRDEMAKNAIRNVLQTFFDGSVERVVATLLDKEDAQLSEEELSRLATMIDEARGQGR